MTPSSKNRLEFAMQLIDEVHQIERIMGNDPNSTTYARIHNLLWSLINDTREKI